MCFSRGHSMLKLKNRSLDSQSLSVGRACKLALALVGSSAFLCTTCLKASFAEGRELKFAVSATVNKHASLKVLIQPSSVVVTAADIAKGYVDVPAAASVQVHSNTQDGYLLMFESQGEFMRQTVVKGLANDVQISAAGGGVAQNTAGRGMRQAQLHLGFRFVLAKSAQKGVYPWPMHLSVTPL